MALTPEEAAKFTRNEEAWIKQSEKEIDNALDNHWTTEASLKIPLSDPPSKRACKKLLELYQAAGWDRFVDLYQEENECSDACDEYEEGEPYMKMCWVAKFTP